MISEYDQYQPKCPITLTTVRSVTLRCPGSGDPRGGKSTCRQPPIPVIVVGRRSLCLQSNG